MNNKLKGGIIVFLGACSFGLLSTIVKTAYGEGYIVGQITGSQAFFGMIILWLLYLCQSVFFKKPSEKKEEQKENSQPKTAWWKVSVAGIFTGLVSVFYYMCVNLLPASIAIILLMQYLWISIIIELLVFKKKPNGIQLIAAAIVLLGTVFAGGVFNKAVILNFKGVLFGMLAATCYAIFLITSGRIGNDLPVLKKSALMITGSCIMIFIVFPPTFFFDGTFLNGLYKWGLILALLGTVIPPMFFSYGMPKTGVSMGAILSAAELPTAVIVSHIFLHEPVEGLQWLGVVLILSSIALTNVKFKKKGEAA